jgi:hypothetical protein
MPMRRNRSRRQPIGAGTARHRRRDRAGALGDYRGFPLLDDTVAPPVGAL